MNSIIKVICLKNDPNKYSRCHYFTIGKIYDCHIISGNYYLKNDKGQTQQFLWGLNTEKFEMVDLEEYRNKQLEQILIEPFNPKKSIIERYGSKETIREIKISKILD